MKFFSIFKRKRIKVGSLVISTDNNYGRDIICEVDRLYKRDGVRYCRLVFIIVNKSYTINVTVESCKLDSSGANHLFI